VVVVALLNRSRSKKQQELLLKAAELQLREAQIEAAIDSQEKERKRFARDLHDGFGQFISVLNLNLKSLEKGASNREEVFESSTMVLDQMYRELKTICFNLMPETLIKQGVVNGIKEFSDRINIAGKVIVEVDTFGIDERLEDLQEISLYRITQEWVNNIIKYSDASKISIQLTKDESEITLMIEDDGNGFEKSLLTSGKGNGWKNLNSRANLIKGELELDTTPGIKGNTLILNVPVTIQAQIAVPA
jgi:signal transduction histidine kinase